MAKELQLKINRSVAGGLVGIGKTVLTITCDLVIDFQKVIPKNLVNARVVLGEVRVPDIQVIAIEADQDATVFFNKPGSSVPTDSLSLKADKPVVWVAGDQSSMKFVTVDFDDLWITTGVNDTLLKVICAQDSTPTLADI